MSEDQAGGRGRRDGDSPWRITPWVRRLMGTVASIHVISDASRVDAGEDPAGEGAVRNAVEATLAELDHLERVFTTFSEDSDIRRIARAELSVAEADPAVRRVHDLCDRARLDTDGLFDAWWRGWVDPTGIVKGWAVETSTRHHLLPLVEAGVVEAVGVNVGGDMQLHTAAKSAWTWGIGVADPFDGSALIARLEVRSAGIATSGTAERGEHLVDPRTGAPAAEVASATVVAPGLTQADLWATTACIAGADAVETLRRSPTTAGLLVGADRRRRSWGRWPDAA